MFGLVYVKADITDISSHMIYHSCWKMYHWQSGHQYGTCMMVLRHIRAALCEVFSVTAVMANWQAEKDPLLAHTLAWLQSSGFFSLGTLKLILHGASVDNEEALDHSPVDGCLSEYPQLPHHLWTMRRSIWGMSRRALKLMEGMLL
jgi:hypothetical protein